MMSKSINTNTKREKIQEYKFWRKNKNRIWTVMANKYLKTKSNHFATNKLKAIL